jgi:hypothetical protein
MAPLVFERAAPGAIPAAWTARLGRYVADPGDDQFVTLHGLRLAVDRGLLVAHVSRSAPSYGGPRTETMVALRAVSDDEAVVVGAGVNEGGALRALPAEAGPVLRYSGFRFRAAAAR